MLRQLSASGYILAAFGFLALSGRPAFADDAGLSAPAAASLGVTTGPRPDGGLSAGPFLVYPSLTIGGVYNDNIKGTSTNKVSGWGLNVNPNFFAVDDQGLHKTTLNLNASGQFYPGLDSAPVASIGSDQIAVSASANHIWTPTPDITVNLGAAFSRSDATFGTLSQSAAAFVNSPVTLNVTNYLQFSDLITANGSVEKSFSNGFFVRTGLSVSGLVYEPGPSGALTPQGNVNYDGFVRAGYRLTPYVSGFVEGGADFMRYQTRFFDSDDYRMIAGLSSDLIGLFRGEIYAGYGMAYSADNAFASVSSPTYGGTIFYYPTRYLTLAANVEHTFGSAATPSPSAPSNSPISQTLVGRLQADYALAQTWSASARVGYARSTYSSPDVHESQLLLGAGLNYNFWRNIGLTFNYDFSKTSTSSTTLPGYTQNVVTTGLTYHY